MERAVVLIKAEQKKQMELIAKKEGVSIADIHRRAIDHYLKDRKAIERIEDALKRIEEILINK